MSCIGTSCGMGRKRRSIVRRKLSVHPRYLFLTKLRTKPVEKRPRTEKNEGFKTRPCSSTITASVTTMVTRGFEANTSSALATLPESQMSSWSLRKTMSPPAWLSARSKVGNTPRFRSLQRTCRRGSRIVSRTARESSRDPSSTTMSSSCARSCTRIDSTWGLRKAAPLYTAMQTDTLKLDALLLSSVYCLGKSETLRLGQKLPPGIERKKTENRNPVGKAPWQRTYEAANRQSANTNHHHRSYARISTRPCRVYPV